MGNDQIRQDQSSGTTTIGVVVMAAAIGAAGWCGWQGLKVRTTAPQQLAGKLLEVKLKNDIPYDFELRTLAGKTVSLKELRNKTVFLNFWATWCPPCIEEMPSLRRLYQRLVDHPNFVFLAVSTDDDWGVVQRFFEREPANFPVLLDAKGGLARRYGTSKFPETYVIDHGRLVGHIIGPRDWDKWYAEAWLRGLLEQRS